MKRVLRHVSGFLLSPPCLLCDAPLNDIGEVELCAGCLAALPSVIRPCQRCAEPLATAEISEICPKCTAKRPLIQEIHSAFAYQSPIDALVLRFKRGAELACGRVLAQLLAERAHAWPRPDLLLAVPLHRSRLRERGFDQAGLIAADVSAKLGIPHQRSLQRTRDTPSQAGLSAQQRRVNVRGAFQARNLASFSHVALIDDVATTASTLNACALACLRAGAKRVDAWVLARA